MHAVIANSLQPHGLQSTKFLNLWDFPGKNAGVDCHFLLQEIFPTQGWNPCLLHLLDWQADSLPLWHQGSRVHQFSSVQLKSLSCLRSVVTSWTAAHQASLSITNSRSSLRLTSIEFVMPSSHLILCHPLLLLPPIPPSIRVFSNESTLPMRWPKYWSFSFNIIPSKEIPGLILRMDWLDILAV